MPQQQNNQLSPDFAYASRFQFGNGYFANRAMQQQSQSQLAAEQAKEEAKHPPVKQTQQGAAGTSQSTSTKDPTAVPAGIKVPKVPGTGPIPRASMGYLPKVADWLDDAADWSSYFGFGGSLGSAAKMPTSRVGGVASAAVAPMEVVTNATHIASDPKYDQRSWASRGWGIADDVLSGYYRYKNNPAAIVDDTVQGVTGMIPGTGGGWNPGLSDWVASTPAGRGAGLVSGESLYNYGAGRIEETMKEQDKQWYREKNPLPGTDIGYRTPHTGVPNIGEANAAPPPSLGSNNVGVSANNTGLGPRYHSSLMPYTHRSTGKTAMTSLIKLVNLQKVAGDSTDRLISLMDKQAAGRVPRVKGRGPRPKPQTPPQPTAQPIPQTPPNAQTPPGPGPAPQTPPGPGPKTPPNSGSQTPPNSGSPNPFPGGMGKTKTPPNSGSPNPFPGGMGKTKTPLAEAVAVRSMGDRAKAIGKGVGKWGPHAILGAQVVTPLVQTLMGGDPNASANMLAQDPMSGMLTNAGYFQADPNILQRLLGLSGTSQAMRDQEAIASYRQRFGVMPGQFGPWNAQGNAATPVGGSMGTSLYSSTPQFPKFSERPESQYRRALGVSPTAAP